MIKKTFNIGEYANGGVISVEINGKDIAVIARDWDFSKGSLKTSDQTNAKEFDRIEVKSDDYRAHQKIGEFLGELTSYYYTEQVLNYIKEHVDFIMA